ncbi:unnamed protein product [Trichogramma brassicae]|uniref:Uncharacterized protein n=1 Tax=Trichogramma brassicae TaxID=86971 RepID=A0A6H5HZJ2_9HYME|nr:unnamed protein product [Trichogramma brassicae]
MKLSLSRPPLVHFVIRTGYRDQPDVDKDGKPLLCRTTAIHRAAMQSKFECVDVLFVIYDKLDVNYIDEFGFTHFHAACMSTSDHIVKKFLELGQHPDCLVQESDVSLAHPPLFLALSDDKNNYRSFWRNDVVRLLLSNGANPNLTDANGMTPLHIIYKRLSDWENLARLFFKINDERHQLVQVNVKDNLGRTPLHWAVANVCPSSVETLLDRGADLSSFVFPSETYFGSRFEEINKMSMSQGRRIVSDTLAILESLKKKGYELNRNDALTVMKFFAYIGKPYWFKRDDCIKDVTDDHTNYLELRPMCAMYCKKIDSPDNVKKKQKSAGHDEIVAADAPSAAKNDEARHRRRRRALCRIKIPAEIYRGITSCAFTCERITLDEDDDLKRPAAFAAAAAARLLLLGHCCCWCCGRNDGDEDDTRGASSFSILTQEPSFPRARDLSPVQRCQKQHPTEFQHRTAGTESRAQLRNALTL